MSEALAREGDISASSTWTVETLRDYFLGLISSNDRRYEAEAAAIRRAAVSEIARVDERFTLAQQHLDKRFELRQVTNETQWKLFESSVNNRFESQQHAVASALAAAKEAVMKAEASAERRFESVNEFRGSLSDQQRTLMPRSEAEALMKAQSDKVEGIMLTLREIRGADKGVMSGWSMAVGVAGLVSLLIGIMFAIASRKP